MKMSNHFHFFFHKTLIQIEQIEFLNYQSYL